VLGDHDRDDVREARCRLRHDRGVDNGETGDAMDAPDASTTAPLSGEGPIAQVPTTCGIE